MSLHYINFLILIVFLSLNCFGGDHVEDETGHAGSSRSTNGQKPVMLYLSSMKDKPEKDFIFESRGLEISELEKCGFDVRDFEVENIEKMGTQLKGGSFPADTPVYIGASHGGGKPEKEEANKLHIDPDGHSIPADELIQSIRAVVPKSSIYLDVCHAGLCRDGKCKGIGTTCAEGQKSNSYRGRLSPVAKAMIDLYCDSIKECKNFEKDIDGKHKPLTGKEINLYMAKKFGKSASKATQHYFNNWSEASVEENKCKSAGHKFACSSNESPLNLSYSYQNSDGGWHQAPRELVSLAHHRKEFIDIDRVPENNFSVREFSSVTKSLLSQRWPKSSEKGASQEIRHLTGQKVPDSYEISESGKEIFGTDERGNPFRLRLDSVSVPEEKSMIECHCISNDKVAVLVTDTDFQEVYFDPSFKLPCRK